MSKPTASARTVRTVSDSLTQRLAALRQRIRAWNAGALLVTNPRDIRYLTGFIGDDSWLLVPAQGRGVTVLSDSRFEEQIQREAPQAAVRMRKGTLADELGAMLGRKLARPVALQADHVTLAQRKKLVRVLGRSGVMEVDDQLIEQRAVKTDEEVRAIRKALSIQQRAFTQTLEQIRPGMTEFEIAAFLEYRMRVLGADGTSFPSIVAVDANASLPHAIPGPAKVRKGSLVLIDWGAKWQGYCSDLTRVIAVGRMAPKLREVYQVVLDAQLAAIDAIAPGRRLKDVDEVARAIIRKAGYGEHFGHGLGHGIGLDIHEQPVLSYRAEGVLEVGQVVTVEPGIYLPGVGGVRIEDDVLVTAGGRAVLSDLPKTLESAII